MFKPERFQGSEVEKGGFKFKSFGSGRRQRPGSGLAIRLMALLLGTTRKTVRVIFRPRETLASALSQL